MTGVIAVAMAGKKKRATTFVDKPSLILFYSFSNLFQPLVRKRLTKIIIQRTESTDGFPLVSIPFQNVIDAAIN